MSRYSIWMGLTVVAMVGIGAARMEPGAGWPGRWGEGRVGFVDGEGAAGWPGREAARPKIVNIINFIRLLEPRDSAITEEVLYQTVVKQVEEMKRYRLGGTFLLQYDALMDPRYQRLLKRLPRDSFEIGAWWELPQPLVEKAGLVWRGRYPWDWRANVGFSTGYTPGEREKLVDVYMADFKKIFGYYPRSVGSWFIDAHTLDYLYRKYKIVASCNCKDQYGTDGYTLWGGYWNQAYYPSKINSYMPAQHASSQIPVPIFRMLGSDPIRQYDDGLGAERQRVITLEPVYPQAGGDSAWVDWYFKQMVEGSCMEYGYTQAGQENSFTWDAMAKGLAVQLPLIARLRDEKKVKVETLAQSGEWFRRHYAVTPATAVTVLEDVKGSDKKTVWFDSRWYRVNLLWEKGGLRFRDIHLFNEHFPSVYTLHKATSNECSFFTLPFVDGYLWSAPGTIAGLRCKAVIGGKETLLEGGDPVVTDSVEGRLHIVWPLKNISGTMVMDLDERRIKIKIMGAGGQRPGAEGRVMGAESADWFLDLSVADRARLPWVTIGAHRVDCRFEQMDYAIVSEAGVFSGEGGSTALRIRPERGILVLDMATASSPVSSPARF